MQESTFINIQCPGCKTSYRIDTAKIPAQGALATCRQCQAKIPIQKPVAQPLSAPPEGDRKGQAQSNAPGNKEQEGSVQTSPGAPKMEVHEEKAQTQTVTAGNGSHEEKTQAPPSPQPDGTIVCPQCGFKQVHPFRCYKCGFVFQQQQAGIQKSTSSNAPQNPKPVLPVQRHDTDAENATLVVKTAFLPLMFFLFFIQPHIEIDGKDHVQDWGTHHFKVKPGMHKVTVYYPYFFWQRCGENSINVTVKEHESVSIDYNIAVPLVFVRGFIRQVQS